MTYDIDRFPVFSEKIDEVKIDGLDLTLPGHEVNVAVTTLQQVEVWHKYLGAMEATCVVLPLDVIKRCIDTAKQQGIIDADDG